MQWIIPGTTLEGDRDRPQEAEQQLSAMFLAGGMVLSQVCSITGVEAYTVQNWVKRGLLPAPQQKRYELNQLCRIINISMLKKVLHMEQIVGLLSYVNGNLDDTSDDIIDDSRLYFMFLRVAAKLGTLHTREEIDRCIEAVMGQYESEVPGERVRVEKVLRIMLSAWVAARLHEQTEQLLAEL